MVKPVLLSDEGIITRDSFAVWIRKHQLRGPADVEGVVRISVFMPFKLTNADSPPMVA
jgi:hypothetical protein